MSIPTPYVAFDRPRSALRRACEFASVPDRLPSSRRLRSRPRRRGQPAASHLLAAFNAVEAQRPPSRRRLWLAVLAGPLFGAAFAVWSWWPSGSSTAQGSAPSPSTAVAAPTADLAQPSAVASSPAPADSEPATLTVEPPPMDIPSPATAVAPAAVNPPPRSPSRPKYEPEGI